MKELSAGRVSEWGGGGEGGGALGEGVGRGMVSA